MKTFKSYKAASETPHGDVTQLLEDTQGFLWVATWNGLIRFDGFDYRLYTRVKEDRTSIPHDVCFSLFEDSRGRMWVSTGRGLAIYNREKDNFTNIIFKDRVKKGVYKIVEDADSTFWALTYVDLLHYDEKRGVAVSFPIQGNDIIDTGDRVWISTENNGIRILDKKKRSIRNLQGDGVSKHIKVMRQASNGDIYIGSTDDGLFVLAPDGKLKKHITANPNEPYSMADNFVQTLYEDKSHRMWIGNSNGNVSILNPQTLTFEPVDYTLPTNIDKKNFTTYSILEDSYDNIWIGTHQFWLLYANKTTNNFTCYQHDNRLRNTISGNPISCILQVKERLFVGTDGGGLNSALIRKMDNFQTSHLTGKAILDIQPSPDGNLLWVGTWGNGLYLYDWQRDRIVRHYGREERDTSLRIPSDNISTILVDGGSVWVGSSGSGVFKIDLENRIVTSHENSVRDPFFINNSKFITHLMKDSDGWIWVSSSEGLRRFKGNQQEKFPYSDKEGELPQNQISCCYEDSQNRIWVLTATNGLMLYDKTNGRFENQSRLHNIPTDLKSIIEDDFGRLWLAARNRIIQFSPETKRHKLFELGGTESDIAFNSKSIFKDDGCNIYIGSNYGMFAFNPQTLKATHKHPHILLKEFFVKGKRQVPGQENSVLENSVQYTNTITLEPDQNDITISYIAIDLEKPNSFRYSHTLEGFDKEWREAGKERQATFSHLPPGKYTFKLAATGHDGSTYTRENDLTVIILPHWWQTWWFRILGVTTTIGILLLLFKVRTQKLLSQKNNLERLVAERTSKLNRQTIELKQKKEEVEKTNRELDEMLSTKNRILSIIAHDLKNPLTAIVGILSLLDEQNHEAEQTRTLIKDASLAAKKLQEQMANILEWARIQTRDIFYSPKNISIAATAKDAVSLLRETADQKQVSISITDTSTHYAYADARMVGTVIRNLVNNAIKFTGKNGKIQIKAEEEGQFIVLRVKDNGIGMDQQTVENLFNKEMNTSTYGTNNEKGSGLGLKICHDFVTSNKGSISVNSEKGKGTTITVCLPAGREIPNELADGADGGKPAQKSKGRPRKRDKRHSILLVDDNKEVLSYLCSIFQNDYDVDRASDGVDALEKAQRTPPDIVLSDIAMPKMDGKELCQTLKSNPLTKHIPVILLTSDDTIESQIDSLTLQADDYMTKPFDRNVLMAKVKSILGNRELLIDHLQKEIISTADNTQMPESRDEQFLRKIKEILEENLSETELSVEFIAEKTALSRIQLFRKFKTLLGTSPSDYIKNYKLQHAARLLASGKYSVADVAYEVGFSDPKYFGSCFTDKFKISPSAYAKQASQEGRKEADDQPGT